MSASVVLLSPDQLTPAFCGPAVTDSGLSRVKDFSDLKHLHVAETGVTDEGFAELRRALPSLEVHR
ncbi:MAG: hypothetical protein JSS02_30740 [Planctomycetes bacterium]|nr:hypothetical protein [Planctomycetota bacterium]